MTINKVNRRTFVKRTAGIGVGFALAGSPFGVGLPRPANASNVVSLDLEVAKDGGRMTYNGKSPGPAILANPGDTIDVRLINNLPRADDDCVLNHNTFHGDHTTNLHTHGLHVSPYKDSSGKYDADNIFLKIIPKDQDVPCWDENFRRHETQYRFELPEDHPPGTYWYHAHKHGSTATQVSSGLAGPLIIRDKPGLMPGYVEKAEEQIFMIVGNAEMIRVNADGGGDVNPTVKLRPGSVQRWRIINGSLFANSFVSLAVDVPTVELWQIAFDGLTLPRRIKIDPSNDEEPWNNPAALAPGNRTDLMIYIPRDAPSQSVRLSAAPADAKFLHTDGASLAAASPAEIRIEIEGDPVDNEWSTDDLLPGSGLEPIQADDLPKRVVTFERISEGLAIDGELYSGQVRQKMALGTSEEWRIQNTTSGTHPFHIHVNPFFVTHIDGKELPLDSPLRRWQDTIALPVGSDGEPGSITCRSRFIDFKGKFVIHCHILFHEDRGMMQAVEVI
ncbi:multicopper oxidase family protein [Anderseniella sp. Alg231-50]|uniref:multicopper oxidase family protein n=1 Tax=Anderseniella sp. Alg231-50 TaxID=1922226 RepID=UPI00307B25DF